MPTHDDPYINSLKNEIEQLHARIAELEAEVAQHATDDVESETEWTEILYRLIDAIGARRGVSIPEDVEHAVAKVAELGATVDTYPTCNRLVNGKIVCDKAVTLEMEVWFWNGFSDCRIEGPEKVTAIISDEHEDEWLANDGLSPHHFYDSREAVEVAKGEGDAT